MAIADAARYVGCSAYTIRREARRNPEFNEQLRKSNLAAELAPLNALRHLAMKYWRGAAWLLERTNPDRYGKLAPRTIKLTQLKSFGEEIGQILAEEVGQQDPAVERRIIRRIDKMMRDLDREVLATNVDPFPLPPRRKKRHRTGNEMGSGPLGA
jgi:hypothetical protein